jgi:hypothetical protein
MIIASAVGAKAFLQEGICMDDHSPVAFGTHFLSGLIGPRPHWLFLALTAGIPAAGLTENPQGFQVAVLALAPRESRAVIQMPSGALINVAPGDVLPEIRARAVGILADKLVLEMTAAEDDSATRSRVWVYRVTEIGKPSRVQFLEQSLPPRPPIHRPVSRSVDVIGFPGRPLPD